MYFWLQAATSLLQQTTEAQQQQQQVVTQLHLLALCGDLTSFMYFCCRSSIQFLLSLWLRLPQVCCSRQLRHNSSSSSRWPHKHLLARYYTPHSTALHTVLHWVTHSYSYTVMHSYSYTFVQLHSYTFIHSYSYKIIQLHIRTVTHSYSYTFIQSYIRTVTHS